MLHPLFGEATEARGLGRYAFRFLLGLPRKNSTKVVHTEDVVKVTLEEGGMLSRNGALITVEELESLVTETKRDRPNMTFLLRIDPKASYQSMVSVVDLVRKLEVENFSFGMMEAAQ